MAISHPFLDRLAHGPILCDGAMGSYLYEHGISYQHCFEELNLIKPELVQSIHLEYIAAGAEIIQTNTFGANRFRLAEHGLEDAAQRINRAGARIAREARDISGQSVFLAGSIGPLGQLLAPVGPVDAAAARAAFREQIDGLLESGIDFFIVETMTDLAEISEALAAIRSASDLPIVAQMSFGEDGLTLSGDDPHVAARTLRDLGADVVGVNCALGPADSFDIVSAMRAACPDLYLSAQPNAGLPRRIGNRFIYMSSPGYFADYARRFLSLGVRIIGGCCGTTPQHTAAMQSVLRELAPAVALPERPAQPAPKVQLDVLDRGDATEAPTGLARHLHDQRFVVSVEMRPPRSIKFSKFLQNAAYLRDCGVDTINITDNAMARVRMSNLAAARLIQDEVGVETIIHFTPRDRNLMAVQSDLIGAHATGIRNILAVTGDPPSHGDLPNATGIWDVDSIGLIAILSNMNQGLDGQGQQVGTPSSFFIGCAATPTAPDIALDIERLHRKIEGGANFIMTQTVFDAAIFRAYFDRYRDAYGPVPIPILVGLQPLHSYRLAEKFHHEVPGIIIPEAMRERLRLAGDNSAAVGVEMTIELLEELSPHVQGVYITPLDRYELAGAVLEHIHSRGPRAASRA